MTARKEKYVLTINQWHSGGGYKSYVGVTLEFSSYEEMEAAAFAVQCAKQDGIEIVMSHTTAWERGE